MDPAGDLAFGDHADGSTHPLANESGELQSGIVAACAARSQGARVAIAAAYEMASSMPHAGLIGDKDISLIQTKDEGEANVLLVRWTDYSKRLARVVTLDRLNRVIFIVAHRVPEMKFESAEILINRAPVQMMKVKGRLRDECPDWVLMIQRHIRASLYSGPLDTSSGESACHVCSQLPRPCDGCPLDPQDVFVCAGCLYTYHEHCAAWVARRVGEHASSSQQVPQASGWKCALCSLGA